MADAENDLIQSLPVPDRKRLLALCEPVRLVLADVLCEAGEPSAFMVFPLDGFISLVTEVPGHAGLEVGMAGREGLFGAHLVLGISAAPMRAVVQGAGSALRVARAPLLRELADHTALLHKLQRYLFVQMAQLATASACRRFHAIEPRLARWLLMSQDRARADEFRVTHEFMAMMLGVRRVGVTVAASHLQSAGLIRYHRGELKVLDRSGLEAQACSCYAADRAVFRKFLES